MNCIAYKNSVETEEIFKRMFRNASRVKLCFLKNEHKLPLYKGSCIQNMPSANRKKYHKRQLEINIEIYLYLLLPNNSDALQFFPR